jgi:hypothetical protein
MKNAVWAMDHFLRRAHTFALHPMSGIVPRLQIAEKTNKVLDLTERQDLGQSGRFQTAC